MLVSATAAGRPGEPAENGVIVELQLRRTRRRSRLEPLADARAAQLRLTASGHLPNQQKQSCGNQPLA